MTDFNPDVLDVRDIREFAASPPEGFIAWASGKRFTELETWFEAQFTEHAPGQAIRDLLDDDRVWELLAAINREDRRATVTQWLPGEEKPHADTWIRRVESKARGETTRRLKGFIPSLGDLAYTALEKLELYACRADRMVAAEQRRKARAEQRKRTNPADDRIATEHGLPTGPDAPIRGVNAALLRKVSAVSERWTVVGKDEAVHVVKVSDDLCLTTAEVTEGQRVGLVYRDGKRWVKTAARVASTEPFGVFSGEVFHRVTTTPGDAGDIAWLRDRDEWYADTQKE